MPNIAGVSPLANPEWVSLDFDDGTSMAVHDPTNEYRAQATEIAQKLKGTPPDPMANATASVASSLVGGAAGAAPAMARSVSDVAAPVIGAAPVAPIAKAADITPAAGIVKTAMKPGPTDVSVGGAPAPSAPAPTTDPAKPLAPPLVTTGTTSTWQKSDTRQSTGIAEADRAKVEAANEGAIDAADEANKADFAAKAGQVWNEWGRLSEKAKREVAERAALQEQERRFDESLNSAYRRLDETAKRPVDPSQAFAGEKGWYAFMAGFGDVLRNVGAALAGQGPVVDPGAVIDQLVERNVNLQMAQKKADYEAGRVGIDRLTADRETVRHRLGVVVSQLADTELQKAHSQQEYQALGALKAKGDAIVSDARAKAAAATARQETIGSSVVSGGSRQTGPAAVGGGGLESFTKLLAARKAYEEAGATPEQLAAFDKATGTPTPGGQSETALERDKKTDLSEAQGKAQAAASAISSFAGKAGLVRDPSSGKWKTGEGLVPPALLEKANPLSDNEINSAFEAAVEAYGRMQSGGVIGDEERQAFREQLGQKTLTRAQLAARLNAAEVTLEGRQAERAKEQRTAPEAWK